MVPGQSSITHAQAGHPADFGHVGLVIGGESAEREVSLKGGRDVAAALERLGVAHSVFDGPVALLDAVRQGHVSRVFNLLHGPCGEDGTLQGALALYDVPFTGSDVLGSSLTMDKIRSKWIWQKLGIPTPDFRVFEGAGAKDGACADQQLADWGFPLFVKPVGQGSSIGVSKVTSADELGPAIELAQRYNHRVMVEPGVIGKEYFAGIIQDVSLPLIRIETPNAFYDYEAKYESDQTRYYCPCGLDEAQEQPLLDLARRAFEVLGAGGWGRVDFILDESGQPWFLEVNTTPGMTDHSLVPQAAARLDIDFDRLVWKILETSLRSNSGVGA